MFINVLKTSETILTFLLWKATQITTMFLFSYEVCVHVTFTNYNFNISQNENGVDTHQIYN